jgi:hypothetical protein
MGRIRGETLLQADFIRPEVLQYAFNVRNMNALQVLDVVWRSVTEQPPLTGYPRMKDGWLFGESLHH